MGMHRYHGARAEKYKKPLDDGGRRLVEGHIEFALKLANKFKRNHPGKADDLDSVALEALVESASSYDPAGGTAFSTWAYRNVVWRIWSFLEYEWLRKRTNRPIGAYEDFEDAGKPVGHEIEEAERLAGVKALAAEAVGKMHHSEQRAARCVYYEGKSYAKAAEDLGLSKSRVGNLCTAGVGRARKALAAG